MNTSPSQSKQNDFSIRFCLLKEESTVDPGFGVLLNIDVANSGLPNAAISARPLPLSRHMASLAVNVLFLAFILIAMAASGSCGHIRTFSDISSGSAPGQPCTAPLSVHFEHARNQRKE